jgi:GTPase involved in cell partitioning and DNA repair
LPTIKEKGQEVVAATGGKGGLGKYSFVSSSVKPGAGAGQKGQKAKKETIVLGIEIDSRCPG